MGLGVQGFRPWKDPTGRRSFKGAPKKYAFVVWGPQFGVLLSGSSGRSAYFCHGPSIRVCCSGLTVYCLGFGGSLFEGVHLRICMDPSCDLRIIVYLKEVPFLSAVLCYGSAVSMTRTRKPWVLKGSRGVE